MVKNERCWQRNREKLDMYHRKNGRMNNIMDASYYKWLLWKMSLFQPQNKLARPSVPDQAEKVRANGTPAAGAGMKTDRENQKNTSLNGQKAQEYEGLWPRWNVKNAQSATKNAIFRSDCTDLQFETSAPCTKNM